MDQYLKLPLPPQVPFRHSQWTQRAMQRIRGPIATCAPTNMRFEYLNLLAYALVPTCPPPSAHISKAPALLPDIYTVEHVYPRKCAPPSIPHSLLTSSLRDYTHPGFLTETSWEFSSEQGGVGSVSDSGWEVKSGTQGTIRDGRFRRLSTGTMETNRPMWDWRWLGKLPGGRGTGGHQVEDIARAKENGRSKLDECIGKGLGVAGAANTGRRSRIFGCCLPALCKLASIEGPQL